MSGTRLGSALRLLPRLTRPTCDPDALRRAADRFCAEAARPGLTLRVDDDGARPALHVEEGERFRRTDLAELAQLIDRRHGDTGPDGLAAALEAWLADRPVPDAEAGTHGVAVLDWTDEEQTAVGWRVAVPRAGALVAWTPHPFTRVEDVVGIRDAAHDRATRHPVSCLVEGPVLLVSAECPPLATAALTTPERVLARAAVLGLRLRDAHVVVTPGRPLAWADAGIAVRLAGETVEPSVTLPWQRFPDLPWL